MTDQQRLERNIFYSPDGCWYWTGSVDHRYGRMHLGGKAVNTHRVAFIIYKGPIPDGKHVCHSCDNTLCVNPDHLWLGTQKQNMEDKVSKNRQHKGEQIIQSKLTEEQISDIKKLYESGKTQYAIADLFKVKQQSISRIVNGVRWKHLHDPLNVLRRTKPNFTHKCGQCGCSYMATNKRSMYCSQDCKQKASYRIKLARARN